MILKDVLNLKVGDLVYDKNQPEWQEGIIISISKWKSNEGYPGIRIDYLEQLNIGYSNSETRYIHKEEFDDLITERLYTKTLLNKEARNVKRIKELLNQINYSS